MDKFTPGFIGYHKATHQRTVTKRATSDGEVVVTTQHGKVEIYAPEELYSEKEWEERNANAFGI